MLFTVTSCTDKLLHTKFVLHGAVVWSVMMPLRASMLAPPTFTALVRPGLSPSTARWSMVTLLDCTRNTLEAPPHSEPPPLPPQLGFETAGSTTVVGPCPVMSTLFGTVTFSTYVPAATWTVPPALPRLTPAWIVFSGSPESPVLKSLPVPELTKQSFVQSGSKL